MQLHVQLACAVRCSATGNSLCDAALNVTVDGERTRYLRRNDGFLLFMELKDGEHRLAFHHPHYHDAHCTVTVTRGKTTVDVVTMRPIHVSGEHLCRLTVTGLTPGTVACISGHTYLLRLQQNDCPEGTQTLRLFKKGAFRLIPPLKLLCADPEAPEICVLMDMLGEDIWSIAEPLRFAHGRGARFFPTQPYEADDDGSVKATFFSAGPVSLLYDGRLYEFNVEQGEQTWQIPL